VWFWSAPPPLGTFQVVRESWTRDHVAEWARAVLGLSDADVEALDGWGGTILANGGEADVPSGLSATGAHRLMDVLKTKNWNRLICKVLPAPVA
jgi:hypothetical protein